MKVYKFRDCYLNTLERQVTKNGKVLDLAPKAFDVLRLLVERFGQVVTKDELLGTVWNGSYVEEGNLAVHISRLRKLLGHSRIERYIEAVQGSGYRFVSLVEETNHEEWHRLAITNGSKLNGGVRELDSANSESYRLYLKGRYLLDKRTVAAADHAIKCFQSSLSYDPTSLLSHVGIVECYLFLYRIDEIPYSAALSKIQNVSVSIAALDLDIDKVHVMFADVELTLNWNFAASEKHLRRALELNPDCLAAHFCYADLLLSVGKASEALIEVRKIMCLDPISVVTCRRIGRLFYRLGSYEASLRYLNDAVELEPTDYEAHALMGAALVELKNYDAALNELNKSLEFYRSVDVTAMLGYAYARQGRSKKALSIVNEIKLLSSDDRKYAIKLARIYSALGMKDLVIDYLDKAFDYHDFDLITMTSDPRFEYLAGDKRFIEFAQRIGIKSKDE